MTGRFNAADGPPTVVLLMPPLPAPSTTGFGFERTGVTGAGGNLVDGPPTLTFVEVLPCEPLGWKITFGLTTFVTPTEPPMGLCRPGSVPGLGWLPTAVPTGPWGVGLTSIGILGGVPRMQRWNSPPESLAQGSLITTTWSKLSGPGTVTFANAAKAATTATFLTAGDYVLRLTAYDGAMTSVDRSCRKWRTIGATRLPRQR